MGFIDNRTKIKVICQAFEKKTGFDFFDIYMEEFKNLDNQIYDMSYTEQKSSYEVDNYIKIKFQKLWDYFLKEIINEKTNEYKNTKEIEQKEDFAEYYVFMQQLYVNSFSSVINDFENYDINYSKEPKENDILNVRTMSVAFEYKNYFLALTDKLNKNFSAVDEYREELKAKNTYHLNNLLEDLDGKIEILNSINKTELNSLILEDDDDFVEEIRNMKSIQNLALQVKTVQEHYNNRFFLSRWIFGGKERDALKRAKQALAFYVEKSKVSYEQFLNDNLPYSNTTKEIINANNTVEIINYNKVGKYAESCEKEYILSEMATSLEKDGVKLEQLSRMLKGESIENLYRCYREATGKNLERYNFNQENIDLDSYDNKQLKENTLEYESENDIRLLDKRMIDLYRIRKGLSHVGAICEVAKYSVEELKEEYKKIMKQEFETPYYDQLCKENQQTIKEDINENKKLKEIKEEEIEENTKEDIIKEDIKEDIKEEKYIVDIETQNMLDEIKNFPVNDIESEYTKEEPEVENNNFNDKMEESFREEERFNSDEIKKDIDEIKKDVNEIMNYYQDISCAEEDSSYIEEVNTTKK